MTVIRIIKKDWRQILGVFNICTARELSVAQPSGVHSVHGDLYKETLGLGSAR